MPAFRSILFPVDFSERCRLAAPFVKAMAARCQAELIVMHVIELPVSIYSTVGHDIILDLPAMRRAAGDQLEMFVQSELAGIPLRMVIDEGHAAPQISHFAGREKIDLVMMPTHGYGTFRRALLGSVTAKVLHDVVCPVWTDAHVEVPLATVQLDCNSILCAVDLDPKNIPLIRHAAELGSVFTAKVRLVHAIPEAASLPENDIIISHSQQSLPAPLLAQLKHYQPPGSRAIASR